MVRREAVQSRERNLACNSLKEVTAPAHNSGGAPTRSLTAEARQFLSRRFISRCVARLGMQEVFLQSQSWKGYESACDSWHNAYWKWMDQEIPADFAKRLQPNWSKMRNPDAEIWAVQGLSDGNELKRFDWTEWTRRRNYDWSQLPCPAAERKRFRVEVSCQEYLQESAAFHYFMRGPDADDPETYEQFFDHMAVARKIGDDSCFKALAKQKQRKPSKDKGDRRLKYLLLCWWIPGCLWAFTAKGIGQFLQDRHDVRPYHLKVIRRAYKGLKLFHSLRPIWNGVSGTPPQLIPRR